ncbi:fatty acyl-AMP ligase [Streptomonospora salina]|uniref:Acyl-CoA synthetase (AMP-forming)/AMP-acid ligase II n=1 Tax=Streptomonospora salina TaxID=104205 RepID=A0A841ED05_9ACTN|nr:fatty acyl-AMP ligase [Streptomonospora salina]MBB6001015.1 acyl-CoA synthetase (AMP-forming)/AMP-acid ligase II [Streptomonospora salina]
MAEELTFSALLQDRLAVFGDSGRFVFAGRDRGGGDDTVLDYAALDRKARAVALLLLERRLTGRSVLLSYPGAQDFLPAFIGCLFAGAVAVPTPLPDRSPDSLDRIARIAADAPDLGAVLTDDANAGFFGSWIRDGRLPRGVECLATDTAAESVPPAAELAEVGPDDVALLQYTSGSTSEPKGVRITQANLLHNHRDIVRHTGVGPESTGVGWLPYYHDMGLIGLLLTPFQHGFPCVVLDPMAFLKRPRRWLELITRHRATHTVAPNFGYELCLRRVGERDLDGLDLSSWRVALNGAEFVRAEVVDGFTERFGRVGFAPATFTPCYGMAETTLLVTCASPHREPTVVDADADALERDEFRPAPGSGGARRLVGCGAADSLDVRVVDADSGDPRSDGAVGEIWVRGPSVADGYSGRPSSTAETFHAYTGAGEGPFLRTGDLGFQRGGELFVTGRAKEVVVLNGRNLYPQDLEADVRRVLPDRACGTSAVFGTGPFGDDVVVVQEVRATALGETSLDEASRRIRSALAAAHRLTPARVVLVPFSQVPRTTSGKVRRGAARSLHDSGALSVLHAWSQGTSEPAARAGAVEA